MTVDARLFDLMSDSKEYTLIDIHPDKRRKHGTAVLATSFMLSLLIVGTAGMLPGPNDNVFAAISMLLSMTLLVALSYAKSPTESSFMGLISIAGIVFALMALSHPVWLWVALCLHIFAGVVVHYRRWVRELHEINAVGGWIAFHAGMGAAMLLHLSVS